MLWEMKQKTMELCWKEEDEKKVESGKKSLARRTRDEVKRLVKELNERNWSAYELALARGQRVLFV